MKVVICEPGQYARIAEIEPTLTAEQKQRAARPSASS